MGLVGDLIKKRAWWGGSSRHCLCDPSRVSLPRGSWVTLDAGPTPLHISKAWWQFFLDTAAWPPQDLHQMTFLLWENIFYLGLPQRLRGRESTRQCRRLALDPWVGKIPWRTKRQPAPVSLPGKSHGQRSLAGHSPWGPKSRAWLSSWRTAAVFYCRVVCFFTLNMGFLIYASYEFKCSPIHHSFPVWFVLFMS